MKTRYLRLSKAYENVPTSIELKPGMGFALYCDQGPSGICGQSMDTTCPHSELHLFKDADALNQAMRKGIGRNGAKASILHGVINDHCCNGQLSIIIHNEE